MSELLPVTLSDLPGIAKNKVLDLRRHVRLGLIPSADEPIRATFSGKVVEADELLERLNEQARRELGPQSAPPERRHR